MSKTKIIAAKHGSYAQTDDGIFIGIHERLGNLRIEVLKGETRRGEPILYERYFFDVDETNGLGIADINVITWFNRP